MVEEHPDVALVRSALAGSPSSRRVLIGRIEPLIRACVRAHLRRSNGVELSFEDVSQQIWVRLWDRDAKRLATFDPARGRTLESFVAMIARQEIIDLVRRKQIEIVDGPLEALDEGPGAERRLEAKEEARRLRAHLDAALPDRGRLILRYLYDDRRDEAEVAEILGVSRQVVANWHHRIRKLARAFREKSDQEKKFGGPT